MLISSHLVLQQFCSVVNDATECDKRVRAEISLELSKLPTSARNERCRNKLKSVINGHNLAGLILIDSVLDMERCF